MKKTAKRGLALLLMLAMCLPLGLESASAADDTPLAGVDGVVDIWKWTKVKTQADLPDQRPTRTVGSTTETYDYALLLVYEHDGQKYYVNMEYANRHTSRGFTMQECFWLGGASLSNMEGADTSLDTFRTKDNIGHMYLRPTGKYDSDNNCKIYNLYADDNSSPLYLIYTDKELGGAWEWHEVVYTSGFCFSDSPINRSYTTKGSNISFCTSDSEPDHVAKGKIKIFANVSGAYDPILQAWDDGSIGSGYNADLDQWDFTAFDVYVGVKEQWSAIRSDYTIQSGMVANYNGYVYIEPDVTVTVEEGGVLSVSGTLYNNGTIMNNGGTVLVQQDASIEQFCLGEDYGGDIFCMGGDLVILNGGRVTVHTFILNSGGTCTNFGVLVLERSPDLGSGATLDNRASGSVFIGFQPKSIYNGNLSSLTRSEARAPATYNIRIAYMMGLIPVPYTLLVGDNVMLYNEGSIYSAINMERDRLQDDKTRRWRDAQNITCKGGGKLYVPESIQKSNESLRKESCLNEWESMYRVYNGL